MWGVSRFRIGARLAAGFGLMLLLIAGLVASSLLSLRLIGQENSQLIEREMVKVAAVSVIDTATRANGLNTAELLLVEPSQIPVVQARIDANRKAIDEALLTLDRLVERPEGKAALAELRSSRAAYVASFVKVGPLAKEGRIEEAQQLLRSETLPALARLQQPIDTLRALQDRLAQEHGQAVGRSIGGAQLLQIGLGAAALVLGLLASVVLARSIVRPLREGVAVAGRIASGDLTKDVPEQGRDEVAELLQSLGVMQDGLRSLVGQVHRGVDHVGSASAQIASANKDLSARTEAQASALEQSAASMEQLSSAIALNADSAQAARTLSTDASRRIAEIIGVIDGIAFQTNILALNAAVEAARAGEQGRGFAVVASEVRALAGRSADAARQIKQLIEASVDQVGTGAALADQAGHAMTGVVASIRRVNQLVVDIAGAMQEQSTGVSQMGEAITQLDQATQQNAALVEETAAASQSLDDQARELVASVAAFQIDRRALQAA